MMTYQLMINTDIEVLDRINAMLLHEEKSTHKRQYNFTSEVNASHRKAMIEWCYTVCDAFDTLQRETVTIATSLLDRYLACNRGESGLALVSRQRFQLASITCFYIAVKTYENVALSLDMLIKLCRGYYTARDVMDMELEILNALEWRVSLSTVTPLDYVRNLMVLLPIMDDDVVESILKNASRHMENATSNVECTRCKTSSIGVVCFAGALNDTFQLSTHEKNVIWEQLSAKLSLVGFDIASSEIRSIEMKLLLSNKSMNCNFGGKMQSPRSSLVQKDTEEQEPTSPVSVMQM